MTPSPAIAHHSPEFPDVNDSPPALTTPETPAQSILFSSLQTFMRQHWSQRTATQQVHMDVVNLLSAMAVGVHDQTIAIFGNTFLLSNFAATVIMRPSACSCSADTSFTVGMRIFGMIRICVGACGEISRNAVTRSSGRRYRRDLTTNNFAEYSFFCHDIFLFQIAMRCAMLRRATLRV